MIDSNKKNFTEYPRTRARLVLFTLFVLIGFLSIGTKITFLASKKSQKNKHYSEAEKIPSRLNILDRNGHILATNLQGVSVYVRPAEIQEKSLVAQQLKNIFPDLKKAVLLDKLNDGRKFFWLKNLVSPKQEKALFDLGQPGVYFGKREYRFYPNGNLASHIIGFTKINELGVNYAKILGISGVEKAFEKRLSAKTLPKSENNAIELSVDLPVQAEVENVLKEWQKRMGAKAGGVVIMDIHSGEILALASSPDFDANKERDPLKEKKDTSIYFNRVVQGVYEMGSTFKLFAVAQGLESDLFDVDTLIDTTAFRISSRKIEDKYKFNRKSSIYEIIVKSSNVGSARLALMVGEKGLKDIFSTLGLFEPVGLELGEANLTSPIIPKDWRDITLATTSYGYGISVSLLHLAKAYAILGNGGFSIEPTILKKKLDVQIITAERDKLDLVNQSQVLDFFKKHKIDQVYLAAAKVGGIYANNTYPADFIYKNLMIQNNIIHSSFKSKVIKLLFLGSSCIYPKFAKQPIEENALLSGQLELTNEPYAIAKIAGIIRYQ